LRDIFPQLGEVFLREGAFGSTEKLPVSPVAPSLRGLASRSDDWGSSPCIAIFFPE